MAQATARILDATCALSSGGLENERTTPRATFRRGQLSLQSNAWQEPNSGEIASSCQLRVKHLLPDPLFFRCIFSGRSRRSERHVATRIGAARSESDNLKGWDCDERAALAEVPAAGGVIRADLTE
jgi:hypothetical protein